MIRLYLLTAMRRIAREKLYAFVCVFSLAIGFASFLIISLYLRSEMTYDQHPINHEQIYRLYTTESSGEELVGVGGGFGPLLVNDNPQLGEYVRFTQSLEGTFRFDDKLFSLNDIWLADQNVFDVFSHNIVYGDPVTALSNPNSIAISKTLAERFFGNGNPLGEILVGVNYNYEVTLVFEDFPENTHFKYSALIPYSMHEILEPVYASPAGRIINLISKNHYTYFRVQPEFDPTTIDSLSARFYDEHFGENFPVSVSPFELKLQPLASIHFGTKLVGDQATGNSYYPLSLAVISLFLLIAASINYVNLATARAVKRARDMGMRKVFGANRSQLIIQLLGESFVFTFLALIIGLLVALGLLNLGLINDLIGKEELLGNLNFTFYAATTVIFGVVVGLISGIYPAFYLSSGTPLNLLRNSVSSWRTGLKPRHGLVFLQLTIAMIVISCTLFVIEQSNYLANKSLGFEKENRVIVQLQGMDVIEQLPTLSTELLTRPDILNISSSQFLPGDNDRPLVEGEVESNDGRMIDASYIRLGVGPNFVSTMGIKLLRGTDFTEEYAEERQQVIVNESMVTLMEWGEPIGKTLSSGTGLATVIGVVPDFHYASLHNPIQPMSLQLVSYSISNRSAALRAVYPRTLIVNINSSNVNSTLNYIGETIRQFDPDLIYSPIFLEERLNEAYQAESNLTKLGGIFAALVLVICLLGLLSLTAYTTEQRTKEIGIRKVLGATIANITKLFWKNILVLILIASIPSSFLSFYVINRWLSNFAYRIEFGLFPLILSLIIVSSLALITVALQCLKTAMANPVDALRYE